MIVCFPNIRTSKAEEQADINVSQESYKHKRLCIRKLVFDDLDYGQDASADLFRSVTMIVSAYPQHNNL